MDDLCDKLRCNHPSVTCCTLSLSDGAQILDALQVNSSVKNVVISMVSEIGWNRNDQVRTSDYLNALVNFLETTNRVEGFTFFPFSGPSVPFVMQCVIKNPFIKELRFCGAAMLTTEQVVGILQMPSLRILEIVLHAELDCRVVADTFAHNNKLEYLRVSIAAVDALILVAVLPQLAVYPSLNELVVEGLPTPPISRSCLTALGQVLVATSSLTQLSLAIIKFTMESTTALVSGLKENQSVSKLSLKYCLFEPDGSIDVIVNFMNSVSNTNPNLKHLATHVCITISANPLSVTAMFLHSSLDVMETSDDVAELCRAWIDNPNKVQLSNLILRSLSSREWEVLVHSLPAMKSIRKLTITEMRYDCDPCLIVQYMHNHWNLQTVVLRSKLAGEDSGYLNDGEQRLIDAYGIRNRLVPTMLANPMIVEYDDIADKGQISQGQEGMTPLSLIPTVFQTALRTKSKSLHILLFGLLSAGDTIGRVDSDLSYS